jgi:ribosomal protein S18 acetylase RimI-like enzyme
MTSKPPFHVRPMVEADLDRVGPLAAELLELHRSWDPQRFFSVDDPGKGYARFFAWQLPLPEVVLLVAVAVAVAVEGVGVGPASEETPAAETETIVGYCYGRAEGRDWNLLLDPAGHLHDVFVAPSHRRLGVAEALCRAAMAGLRERGVTRFVAHIWVGNAASRALTKRLGFRETMVEVMAIDEETEATPVAGEGLPVPGV